ncbi:ribonuclease P protein subunit p38 isoform X2 [Cuculus canorus]|uniref:ribonuclease P protein subunit p38 isoform X2 n=1 Tax=Cuculus canorus TaxID=55661 RepID=UPI0023AAA21B|nr:ribonuclease P protein subunit p38 isoform X2 [Cuculus canorus]
MSAHPEKKSAIVSAVNSHECLLSCTCLLLASLDASSPVHVCCWLRLILPAKGLRSIPNRRLLKAITHNAPFLNLCWGGKTQKNLKMSVIQPGTATLRKAKKITVKTCLDNPFVFQWKTIEGEDMHFILQTLEERIKHVGLKKIETPRKKKRSPRKIQTESKCDASTSKLLKKEEEAEGHRQNPGWTDISIRRQLAIGVNEVTKALEKNELLLLLVCKSAKPAMITSHLIQLSASRATPAGQVPRLSETVAPLLGLTSILALGFKKQSDKFTEVVEAIIPKIPALEVPWFQYRTEESMAYAHTDSSENHKPEQLAEALEDELTSQKRKRTESNQLDLSNVILQPLKIKKLVPNPNKIKKPPRKKKKAFSA